MLTRLLSPLCLIAAAGAVLVLADPGTALAKGKPIVVTPGDGSNSGVGIGVHGPGSPGVGGSKPHGGGQAHSLNPCLLNGASAACLAWNQVHFCSAIAADWAGGLKLVSLRDLSAAQLASLNTTLRANGCPARAAGGAAAPTAAQLAVSAYGRLRLPSPVPGRYPSGSLQDGHPYTIVNTRMWFWAATASWRSLGKTVCAGGLCATATATPVSLTFDPGNGDAPVTCPGSGTAWARPMGGSWIPNAQPQGCDYRYRASTFGAPGDEVTASYTITWHVSWRGTNGTTGTLNPLTTSADSRFAVAELQSVASG